MSTTLMWRLPQEYRGSFSNRLKMALHTKYDYPIDIKVNKYDILFFEGLSCAGFKEADDIINLINQYGEINLSERS